MKIRILRKTETLRYAAEELVDELREAEPLLHPHFDLYVIRRSIYSLLRTAAK